MMSNWTLSDQLAWTILCLSVICLLWTIGTIVISLPEFPSQTDERYARHVAIAAVLLLIAVAAVAWVVRGRCGC
jgi:hypothetical protein